MTAVYKKELKTYFTGMTGAIFIGFLLLMTGIFTTVFNLRGRYPNFEYALSGISFIYMLVVPVLTMRSVAEERHAKTDQLLYSLPMRVTDIVLAKYLAMLTILAIPCAVMALYPLLLASFGTVHLSTAYAALFAFFLLGAALLSIGMFISSLTESQVIAAVVSLGVMVLLHLMSGIAMMVPLTPEASFAGFLALSVLAGILVQVMIHNKTLSVCVGAVLGAGCTLVYLLAPQVYAGVLPAFLSSIALFDRLLLFQDGVFDLTAVLCYLSVTVLFVYLTVQSMEKKRWN